MTGLARYLNVTQAVDALERDARALGVTEFAEVRNLDFVSAPHELYPLAPRVQPPLDRIVAFVVDMDGTSTTTEPLALHALEYMVRRITGRPEKAQWEGLDERLDYPHIVGSSNFRHTEFLVARYRDFIDSGAFAQAYVEAVCWTLAGMTDAQRRREAARNAEHCGLRELLADDDFGRLVRGGGVDDQSVGRLAAPLAKKYGPAFRPRHEAQRVAAALDIYYMRYHAILRRLEQGEGDRLAAELLGQPGRRLIAPMPGYEVFVPLIRGRLGPEVDAAYERLRAHLLSQPQPGHTAAELDAWRPRLVRLAEHFRRRPAKLALVTASIAYETRACLNELLQVMGHGGAADTFFDAVVCATDVWEARLKPHRDLYSLALFQMSVPRSDYGYVIGLEDTEPGIIALRAAGIGCAVALPNRDTQGQNYAAATDVVAGGLPELILARNLLLRDS